MKHFTLLLICALYSTFTWGQQSGDQKIAMDVDKTVFSVEIPAGYANAEANAALVAGIQPNSFEKLRANLFELKGAPGQEIIERKELEINGQSYLYLRQTAMSQVGKVYAEVYAKANGDESSIMITGTYSVDLNSEKYSAAIKKAALSARVKE